MDNQVAGSMYAGPSADTNLNEGALHARVPHMLIVNKQLTKQQKLSLRIDGVAGWFSQLLDHRDHFRGFVPGPPTSQRSPVAMYTATDARSRRHRR